MDARNRGQSTGKRGINVSQQAVTKAEIIHTAQTFGAKWVGFSASSSWRSQDIPIDYHPYNLWPLANTVIVVAAPLLLLNNVSNILERSQSTVAGDLLDETAYRLAVFLNQKGYPSVNIPSNSNGTNMSDLKAITVFSHAWAGYYAGLTAKPENQAAIASKTGVPLALAAVFTALEWPENAQK